MLDLCPNFGSQGMASVTHRAFQPEDCDGDVLRKSDVLNWRVVAPQSINRIEEDAGSAGMRQSR